MIVGFAGGGEARVVAAYRRSYNAATGHGLSPSRFIDRFTDELADHIGDLLEHAIKGPVPHHLTSPSIDSVASSLLTPLSSFLMGVTSVWGENECNSNR